MTNLSSSQTRRDAIGVAVNDRTWGGSTTFIQLENMQPTFSSLPPAIHFIGASEDGLLWSSKPDLVREEAIRRKERQGLYREVSL